MRTGDQFNEFLKSWVGMATPRGPLDTKARGQRHMPVPKSSTNRRPFPFEDAHRLESHRGGAGTHPRHRPKSPVIPGIFGPYSPSVPPMGRPMTLCFRIRSTSFATEDADICRLRFPMIASLFVDRTGRGPDRGQDFSSSNASQPTSEPGSRRARLPHRLPASLPGFGDEW